MAKKFDAIIIGTGQSGPSLAARMTREGMNTAIASNFFAIAEDLLDRVNVVKTSN